MALPSACTMALPSACMSSWRVVEADACCFNVAVQIVCAMGLASGLAMQRACSLHRLAKFVLTLLGIFSSVGVARRDALQEEGTFWHLLTAWTADLNFTWLQHKLASEAAEEDA